MKKGIYIAVGVAALLAVMVWADHKFPAGGSPSASSAAATPTDAPTVGLQGLDGKDTTLQQYKGQVVLVNFWATWCGPCKVEIPWMIEFQQKYSPRGFTILGVSMDEDGKKAVQPFLDKERFDVGGQQMAMNYPIFLGSDAIGEKFGGILGLPTTMLFNRDGKKVRTIVGLVNHDDLSKAIEGLL
jgi:cytochrome c biogenesis protein CcmG/thiol:disulfide interchange protein DsbE